MPPSMRSTVGGNPPPFSSGGHPGKGAAPHATPGSREGETGRREPAPARSGHREWRGAAGFCSATPVFCAPPPPPSLFGLEKTLRTLVLRVRGMGSLAFSGLNSLLGSPLCCVGDDEAEWGRGGGTSRSLQIPWGAKTCDLNEWFIDVLLKPLSPPLFHR